MRLLTYILLFLSTICTAQTSWFRNYTLSEQTSKSIEISWSNAGVLSLQDINYAVGKSTQPSVTKQTGAFAKNANDDSYTVKLEGLEQATAYTVHLLDTNTGNSLDSVLVTTASTSTGQIKVYFNAGINAAVGLAGNLPTGTTGGQLSDATITMINNAKSTVDVAMYNTNYVSFVNALKAAKARGVRVRMIADADQSNYALSPSPGFPLLYGNDNQGIMHNKFVIIDADATDPNDPWVSSGSTNWTTNQVLYDPNNLIVIQDQALARAYQTEFEEMWGSNGPNPNSTVARFGSSKTDNTPHLFTIGGKQVELWFSPSDQPNTRITSTLNTAQYSIDFGLLLITKDDLAATLIAKKNGGLQVRGIIEDDDQLATPYFTMKNAGVPIFLHTAPQIFHHKYAIVDAFYPASDPSVLTGSHNWTYTAHTYNDENTLVIHSDLVADLYRKEFEKRYVEVNPLDADEPMATPGLEVMPNPSSDYFSLRATPETSAQIAQLFIYDALGRIVEQHTTLPDRIDCSQWPSGIYQLTCIARNGHVTHIQLARP